MQAFDRFSRRLAHLTLAALLLDAGILPFTTGSYGAPTIRRVSPEQASGLNLDNREALPWPSQARTQVPTTQFGWPLAWPMSHPRLRITNYADHDLGFGILDYTGGDFTYDGHRGTDINANSFQDQDEGIPVLAAANGRVIYVQDIFYDREISAPALPWNVVWLLHEDGTQTAYGHLRTNSATVQYGEYVREGQKVGLMGSSGFTLMPHLHFEVWPFCDINCPYGGWVDPWSGSANPIASLWRHQEPYVGGNHLQVHDLSVTTPTAFAEVDRGRSLSAFKERPSEPIALGISEPSVTVWALVSGQVGDPFWLDVYRANGALYGRTEMAVEPIDRAWGQGWHYRTLSFALDGAISAADYGEWRAELRAGGLALAVRPFTVGETTRFAPRFRPVAGKSFHLSSQTQRDTLTISRLGAPLADLAFALEGAPGNVSLLTGSAGQTIISIGPAGPDLVGLRSREFSVVATDRDGAQGRMHYQLVNYAASTLGSPPAVLAPATASAFEGETISLDVRVTDGDGDRVETLTADLSSFPSGTDASFVADPGNLSGRLIWRTKVGDAGAYSARFGAQTSLGGGTAAEGFGLFPIVETGHATSAITVLKPLTARAFTTGGDKTIRLSSGKPRWCVAVEPIAASFSVTDLDPSSLWLVSTGTGTIDRIPPSPGKGIIVADRDHDGVEDASFCFSKEDLRKLFDRAVGRSLRSATVEGTLRSGGRFSGVVELDIVGGEHATRSPSVAPNPLNPEGVLEFDVRYPGPVRVQIFDTEGRLVRTLLDAHDVPAGPIRVRVDGRSNSGNALGSGIYFFRISTSDGTSSGRLVVLK